MHEHKQHIHYAFDIHRIFSRLIRAQNEGRATIFFDLQGHCQVLTVRVYAPVWVSGAEPSYKDELYLDTKDDEKVDAFIKRLFTYLNTL